MHFSVGNLVLDCICNVKYEAFFIVTRPFLDKKNSMIFLGISVFLKIKFNNFLV